MKRFFVGLGRFLRKFCGILFALAAFIYVCVAIFEPELRVPMIVAAVVCTGLAWLLLRKKKPADAPCAPDQPVGGIGVSFAPREVPADILRDMRKTYTKANAIRDAEIMRESFLLCQQTCDIGVFAMRCLTAQRKALTLLQAEQAKCRGVAKLNTRKAAESVLKTSAALKMDFLDRLMQKEFYDALALKTARGQRNRLQKLLNGLQGNEPTFTEVEDEYNAAVKQIEDKMAEIEKAGEV